MKRKSLFIPSAVLFKVHILIFTLVMIGLWLTIPSMTYYGDTSLPGVTVNFKQHTVNLLSITMLWTCVLIAHFGLYRLRGAQQRSYLALVEHIQKRYVPESRLDVDDDQIVYDDESINEDALKQHLQVR